MPKTTSSSIEASRPYTSLTKKQKKRICKYASTHKKSQEELAEWTQSEFRLQFPPSQSTMSRLLGQASTLEAIVNKRELEKKRERSVKSPLLEEAIILWIKQREANKVPINQDIVKEVAKRLAAKMQLAPEDIPLFSNGWMSSFSRRHGLRRIRLHGESASVQEDVISDARPALAELVNQYAPRDVFNFDETGLFYQMAPDKTIATRQIEGSRRSKTRITVALACNSDGSTKLPPLFIGHSKRPQAFQRKPASHYGLSYRHSPKAWMNGTLFREWLLSFDRDMAVQRRRVLLLLDNAASHDTSSLPLEAVAVHFLPPNTTARLQPLDAGIIAAFKSGYRKRQLRRAIELDEAGQTNLYKIDVLTAMRWAVQSWDEVSAATIQNCWRHVDLFGNAQGFSASNSSSEVPQLDEIAELLCQLRVENSMTARELINIPGEDEVVEELNEDEIVELVTGQSDEMSDDLDSLTLYTLQDQFKHIRDLLLSFRPLDADDDQALSCLRRRAAKLDREIRNETESRLSQRRLTDFFK